VNAYKNRSIFILILYRTVRGKSYEKKIDLAKKGFENALRNENRHLYRCIYEDSDFTEFRRLKEFRDIVHHKHALHVENVKLGFNGPETVMIPIDPKSKLIIDGKRYRDTKLRKKAEAVSKESIVKYGLKESIVWVESEEEMLWKKPLDFCSIFIKILARFYTSIYERMLIELKRKPIGKVKRYYQRIGVGVIELSNELSLKDRILIEGATTSFVQSVSSIEIDRKKVLSANIGQLIGLKVNEKVREGDLVFKLPASLEF